jgi:hypothetical protein
VKYKLSRHARLEMERRGISLDLLEQLLQNPQQIVPETRGKKAYQSINQSLILVQGRNSWCVRLWLTRMIRPSW